MSNKTIYFETLGCAKNTVYSEYMMGLLDQTNYELVNDPALANVIVVNTCGFITAAKEESINAILDLNTFKENGKCDFLIAIGCMVQKYSKEMEESLPELDLLLGSTAYSDIISQVDLLYKGKEEKISVNEEWQLPTMVEQDQRILTTPSYYAYLTIAEGCNNRCTFCAIPEMQGPYRSRKMEDILKEANMLAKKGIKELIVIAQDITYYGMDIYNELSLPTLLHELCKIDGIKWIRLLYAYPNNFTDELIEVIANEEKICKYIDIPLQHADDDILKAMNRKIDQARIRSLIGKLRDRIPNMIIRSTFIAGFPGETEEAYNHLVDFIEDVKLDRVGAFPYSQEENTPAGKMENQLPEDVKEARAQNLMDIQFEIMYENHKNMVGQQRHVLIDDIENNLLLCRSYAEAPDVDPYIIVPFDPESMHFEMGQELDVVITDLHEYDLIGSIIA